MPGPALGRGPREGILARRIEAAAPGLASLGQGVTRPGRPVSRTTNGRSSGGKTARLCRVSGPSPLPGPRDGQTLVSRAQVGTMSRSAVDPPCRWSFLVHGWARYQDLAATSTAVPAFPRGSRPRVQEGVSPVTPPKGGPGPVSPQAFLPVRGVSGRVGPQGEDVPRRPVAARVWAPTRVLPFVEKRLP